MEEHDNQKIRILVADDDDFILRLYQQVLGNIIYQSKIDSEIDPPGARLSGGDKSNISNYQQKSSYELTVCRQSKEAVEAFHDGNTEGSPYAVAFLDVRMPPGPDGIWAAEKIRSLSPDAQIVIVTGYSDIDPATIAKRVPPTNRLLYIQKPFHPHEIRQFASTLAAKWHAERKLSQINRKLELTIQQRTAVLQEAYDNLKLQAIYDPLTSLLNRGAVLSIFKKELSRMKRTDKPLSIIMADIDKFKSVNDMFGHPAGDAVLKETAERMQNCLRPYDSVGRYGGEEFIVIIPGCDKIGAKTVAERIRISICHKKFKGPENEIAVTMSLGITTTEANKNISTNDLIAEADKALYRAKSAGRNMVKAAVPGG